MNVLEIAGLGCTRGEGESLLSWVSAGPLGATGAKALGLPPAADCKGGRLFCPACRLETSGQRRWYSRDAWDSPGCVVCIKHALPLVRSDDPPTRLRSRRWPPGFRVEFRALGHWTQVWVRQDMTRRISHGQSVEMAVVHALLARTDPRVPFSTALACGQWELWLEGWPVSSSPRFASTFQGWPLHQSDRLALMAIAYRICSGLERRTPPVWMPLLVRSRTLAVLRATVGRLRPGWGPALPDYFRCSAFTRSGHASASHLG